MSQSDLTNKLLSGILDQVKKNGSISSGSRQGSSLDLDDAEKLTKQFEKQAGLLKQMNLSVQEYAERQSEYSETASQINKVMESNQHSFGKMVGLAKEMNKALGFTQRLFRPITKVLDGIKTRAKVFSDINKDLYKRTDADGKVRFTCLAENSEFQSWLKENKDNLPSDIQKKIDDGELTIAE